VARIAGAVRCRAETCNRRTGTSDRRARRLESCKWQVLPLPAAELATVVSEAGALSSGAASAALMKFRQILAGSLPPVRSFIGVSSSLPTQNADDQRFGEPDEPGIAMVLAGGGLARSDGSEIGFPTCAPLDDQPQQTNHIRLDRRRSAAGWLGGPTRKARG
jgi:hypothetical protein